MDNTGEQPSLEKFFDISFDNSSREHIKTIATWARIMAICAFAGYVLVLIVAFFGKLKRTEIIDAEGYTRITTSSRAGTILATLIAVAIGSLLNYFLYRFSVAAKEGVTGMNQLKLNEGLGELKTYFKILGILLIIGLSAFVIAILFAILATGMGSR
ncbi:MAG TPA: hypothetical protein VMI35_11570 [Puia sp.]|nr:hypothetical protein [Puia sp.]